MAFSMALGGFPPPWFPDPTFLFLFIAVIFAFAITIIYCLFVMGKMAKGEMVPVGFVGMQPIFMKKREVAHCPKCGATTIPGWRYCPSCGYELGRLSAEEEWG